MNEFSFLESDNVNKRTEYTERKNRNATASVCQLSDIAAGYYNHEIREQFDLADLEGNLRVSYFKFKQVGDAPKGSQAILAVLPAGRKRILGNLCRIYNGLSCKSVSVGWASFISDFNNKIDSNFDGMDKDIPIERMKHFKIGSESTTGSFKFISNGGVPIIVTFQSKVKDGDTLEGYLIYI